MPEAVAAELVAMLLAVALAAAEAAGGVMVLPRQELLVGKEVSRPMPIMDNQVPKTTKFLVVLLVPTVVQQRLQTL